MVWQRKRLHQANADHGSPVGVRGAFDILRGLQEDAGECGYVDEDGAGADEPPEPEGYPRLYGGWA